MTIKTMSCIFFSFINRASVAGFTNINFTVANKIMGEQSYVSFSPCSEVVSLPQDPGMVNVGLTVLRVHCVWRLLNYNRFHDSKTPIDLSMLDCSFLVLQCHCLVKPYLTSPAGGFSFSVYDFQYGSNQNLCYLWHAKSDWMTLCDLGT